MLLLFVVLARGDVARATLDVTHVRTLSGHSDAVTALTFSADGQYVVSGSRDRTLKIWRLSDWSLVTTLSGHGDWVNSVSVTEDGRYVVSTSEDGGVKVWNLTGGSPLVTFIAHGPKATNSAVFWPYADGNYVVSGGDDDNIMIWRRENGTIERTIETDENVTSVAVSRDGAYIISGHDNYRIEIWNLSDGSHVRTIDGQTAYKVSVAVSRDGQYILSSGTTGDYKPRVYTLPGGALVASFHQHQNDVYDVKISYDNKYGLTASSDRTVKVWELTTGALGATLNHDNAVFAVAISPDGKYIASGGADNTVRIWQVTGGEPPPPVTWELEPAPPDTSSMNMIGRKPAEFSSSVAYYFEAIHVGAGETSSGWQTGNSYNDAGLVPNTRYEYRFKVKDLSTTLESEWSSVKAAYTRQNVPGIREIARGPDYITLEATGLRNPTAGQSATRWYTDSGLGANGSDWTTDLRLTDTGLEAGRRYRWQVKARNGDGRETSYSSWYPKCTTARTPVAPAALYLGGGKFGIIIQSDGNSSVVEYAVYCNTPGSYVSSTGGLSSSPVWRTRALWGDTVKVTGLNKLVANSFKVWARNLDGELSSWSANSSAVGPITAVLDVGRGVAFALDQNSPNPFNPSTTIRFSTPDAGPTVLSIYDANGRLVRLLVDGTVEAGTHEVVWDGRDALGREVSSGVYLYRLTSGQGIIVRKMVLVR